MNLLSRLGTFLICLFPVIGCGKKASTEAAPAPELTPVSEGQSSGIEGSYLIVGGEFLGKKETDEEIAKGSELDRTVKINKDQIQFKFGRRVVLRYKLDPSKSPAEIDLFDEEAGKKSSASYGIYKVEGDRLTVFLLGAKEPQLRPREFVTLDPFKKEKGDNDPVKQVGGRLVVTLKKVSNDTTFIVDAPPKPKPPEIDLDGPVVAELTKKGFTAEKHPYGMSPGINVTVPQTLPLEALKALNGQPRIRWIKFETKFVTDEAIQGLNKLDGLFWLEFNACPKLTAAAFRDLSRFPQLTRFESYTPPPFGEFEGISSSIDDTVMAELAKVKTLNTIWLTNANVTVSGIKLLNALSGLEELTLQKIPSLDAALGELNLPNLTNLFVGSNAITDEGLGKLPVLPKLQKITLGGPKLTNSGLKHLLKQPSLEYVALQGTKITTEEVKEFQKLKPKLKIEIQN